MEKLQWEALEYDERERSQDWFWALGVIVVTSSIASIIFSNYFFAVLLILSGVLLGFFAIRKPEMVPYELNERGLQIRSRLYPYENIKSFWVQVESTRDEQITRPTLFVKTERLFMPVLSIPIDSPSAPHVHEIMTAMNIPEEEMHEHMSQKIMEALGF